MLHTAKCHGEPHPTASSAPPEGGRALPAPLALLLGLVCSGWVLTPDALAIPSPDVVIGLFASLAQALGLLSVVAGGWLWKRRKSGGSDRGAKGWRIAALASSG